MRREDVANLMMFLAVAEERSFTRAAARLGTSQSALSHAMRRLEQSLGLRLLTRTTRSVALTEPGERLIDTLRPALRDIDDRLAELTMLRDRPSGTIRISTSDDAGRRVLWPAVDRLITNYPDIKVELNVDSALSDIVAERYDAGVRLGERLEKDMIAMRIGPPLRMAAVAAPAYLAGRTHPVTPHDLGAHQCINLRMVSGTVYAWEFDKDGHSVNVRVDGPLILNRVDMILNAALAGHGIAFMLEDHVEEHLAAGRLVRLLEDWCEPFDGYYLYYPDRRQPSAAFRLLLDALRYRG